MEKLLSIKKDTSMNKDRFFQLCEKNRKNIVYSLAHLPDRVWYPIDIYPSEINNYKGHEIFQLTSKLFYDKNEVRLHLARNLYKQSAGTIVVFESGIWNQVDITDSIILYNELLDVQNMPDTALIEMYNSNDKLNKIVLANNDYLSYLRKSLEKYKYDLGHLTDLDLIKGIIPLLLWQKDEVKYFEFNSLGDSKGYYFALKNR